MKNEWFEANAHKVEAGLNNTLVKGRCGRYDGRHIWEGIQRDVNREKTPASLFGFVEFKIEEDECRTDFRSPRSVWHCPAPGAEN